MQALEDLKRCHPVLLEGMGDYDERAPAQVTKEVPASLHHHWLCHKPTKPLVLATQSDPHRGRGVTAISRLISDMLSIPRLLIYLDEDITGTHYAQADFYRVTHEIDFSSLRTVLNTFFPGGSERLQSAIDDAIRVKNNLRQQKSKPPLAAYYRDSALLQETTKGVLKNNCEEITVAQTSTVIHPFSVASFF